MAIARAHFPEFLIRCRTTSAAAAQTAAAHTTAAPTATLPIWQRTETPQILIQWEGQARRQKPHTLSFQLFSITQILDSSKSFVSVPMSLKNKLKWRKMYYLLTEKKKKGEVKLGILKETQRIWASFQ